MNRWQALPFPSHFQHTELQVSIVRRLTVCSEDHCGRICSHCTIKSRTLRQTIRWLPPLAVKVKTFTLLYTADEWKPQAESMYRKVWNWFPNLPVQLMTATLKWSHCAVKFESDSPPYVTDEWKTQIGSLCREILKLTPFYGILVPHSWRLSNVNHKIHQ